MHARVCSRWIKVLARLRPSGLDFAQEWAWIEYQGRRVAADSLFQLLEARIPCGAQFSLYVEDSVPFNAAIEQELDNIISLAAFEMTA